MTTDTATATATTTKRSRTPISYKLVAVQMDEKGEINGIDFVPQPKIEKENPNRSDYKRAVRRDLEDGTNAEHYNGKQLIVIGFPKPFCFQAKVETVEIRKVSVTES